MSEDRIPGGSEKVSQRENRDLVPQKTVGGQHRHSFWRHPFLHAVG